MSVCDVHAVSSYQSVCNSNIQTLVIHLRMRSAHIKEYTINYCYRGVCIEPAEKTKHPRTTAAVHVIDLVNFQDSSL